MSLPHGSGVGLQSVVVTFPDHILLYRGSYMSAYVLLILLNELGKEIKCEAC